jgi:transposase-like protein
MEQFGENWRAKYTLICKSWGASRPDLRESFKYPQAIRRAIRTTNAIESLNRQSRKAARNRSALASGEAIYKIMFRP